jgi:hypothetical protein
MNERSCVYGVCRRSLAMGKKWCVCFVDLHDIERRGAAKRSATSCSGIDLILNVCAQREPWETNVFAELIFLCGEDRQPPCRNALRACILTRHYLMDNYLIIVWTHDLKIISFTLY